MRRQTYICRRFDLYTTNKNVMSSLGWPNKMWREMECKMQMELWDMTVLRHSVCSNMACMPSAIITWPRIHMPKPRSMRWLLKTMHWGKWVRCRWIQWWHKKPVFITLHGQPPGTSMESARLTLSIEKKKKSQSQSPASNINQPVPAHPAHQSVGHAVESGRPGPPNLCDVIHCGYRV